jgi:hypothetical protein
VLAQLREQKAPAVTEIGRLHAEWTRARSSRTTRTRGIEEVLMIHGDLAILGQALGATDYISVHRGAQHGVPRTAGVDACAS